MQSPKRDLEKLYLVKIRSLYVLLGRELNKNESESALPYNRSTLNNQVLKTRAEQQPNGD